MGYAEQISFVIDRAPQDHRIPETWLFTSREAHNWIGMILVADEVTRGLKKRRDREARRRLPRV